VKRANRLRKGAEFDRVYAEGTVLNGPFFVVRYLENELGLPRWGFAVGKRLSKHAVDRNRTKRRLREAADALQLAFGADIVLTAKQPAMDAPQQALATALAERMQRIAAESTAGP
jgi:ribonuclease P protein component